MNNIENIYLKITDDIKFVSDEFEKNNIFSNIDSFNKFSVILKNVIDTKLLEGNK